MHLAKKHEITVVAQAATFEPLHGARLVTVGKQKPLLIRMFSFFWQLFLASRGVQVIYAQRALAAGVPAVVVGWLRRVPVVVNFVGDELGEDASPMRRWLQGAVLRSARRVVVPSEYLARLCQQQYGVARENITVCPVPLPLDQILPFTPQRDPQLVLVPRHKTSVAAAAAIRGLVDGSRLVVLGDYSDIEALRALANGRHVEFLGRVSAAEAWFYTRQATTCVVDLNDELGEEAARAAAAAGAAVKIIGGGVGLAEAPTWESYVSTLVSKLV